MSEDNLKLWSCYPNENNIENFESLQTMPLSYEATGNFFEEEAGEGGYGEDGEGGEFEEEDYGGMESMYNIENMENCVGDNCLFQEDGEGGYQEDGEGDYQEDGEGDYQEDGEGYEGFEDEDGESASYEEEGEGGYEEESEDVTSPGYENFTETASEKDMELWTCYPSNKVENFQNSDFLGNLKAQVFGTGANADLYMWIVIAVVVALVIYYVTQEKKN
jgi:hypothetical protein